MKNIDVPLSEHVAKEASQQINKLSNELEGNKDSFIFFLKDVVNDGRNHVNFLRKIIGFLFITIIVLILGLIALSVYHQYSTNKQAKESTKQIMDFFNDFDFYSEVELMNEDANFNYNNLNVNK